MQEHLRYLPSTRRCRSRAAQRRPAVGRRRPARTTTSRPRSSPSTTAASSPSSASASSAAAAAPRPSTSRQVVEAVRGPRAGRAHARATSRRQRRSTPRSVRPGRRASCIIGERTNANGSKAFREAMLAGDWDTLRADGQRADPRGRPRARRLRRLRRPRRHRRHGRDRQALRHPGQRAARARLHRAAGARGRRCSGSAAGPSSTRPTSRTASCPAPASTGSSRWPASTAPR